MWRRCSELCSPVGHPLIKAAICVGLGPQAILMLSLSLQLVTVTAEIPAANETSCYECCLLSGLAQTLFCTQGAYQGPSRSGPRDSRGP